MVMAELIERKPGSADSVKATSNIVSMVFAGVWIIGFMSPMVTVVA